MPSVGKSDKWFIRITASWDHVRSHLSTIKNWIDYDGMMVGLHHGDKRGAPHAHICLRLKGELQKQSIDVRMKKLYGVAGAQYSSKAWDGNLKAMSYLYHDVNGEVMNEMGMDEKEISELKDLNCEIQKVVEVNKGRASNKIVQYVLTKANDGWSRYDIGECILRAVANGEFYDPGDFALERYINEIELKLVKDNKEALRDVIHHRLNRLSSFRR